MLGAVHVVVDVKRTTRIPYTAVGTSSTAGDIPHTLRQITKRVWDERKEGRGTCGEPRARRGKT